MFMPIELPIHLRAAQAEIGAQVNHPRAAVDQGNGELGGDAMRQRQEHKGRLVRESPMSGSVKRSSRDRG